MKRMTDSVKRRIDALVAAVTGSGGPGAAVGVLYGGQLAYQGCFGLAEVEWRQPVGPDTVFALGSVSKPFTAVTVMLLARDGLIDIDAPVSTYLPGYPGPGRAVLVRHLLTHTSGIPNFLTLPGFRDRAGYLDHTSAELVEVFAGLPLDFAPGSRYGYSNSGYRLLDIIAETVTGEPFADVIAGRVFRPAGMTTARLLTDRAVIPRRARGYEISGGEVAAARHLSMTITGGAGGLAASLEDMAVFDRALRDRRLIGPDLDREMRTPVRLSSGRTEGYGLGWVLTAYRGTPVVSHAGGIDGFSGFYARFPDRDISIVILANREGFPCYHLARKITDEIAGLPGPAETAPTGKIPVPAELAGTYRDTLATLRISADGGQLIAEQPGVTRTMVPVGGASFVAKEDPDIRLSVHPADGSPAAVTLDFPFTWFTGYRSADQDPAAAR